ncbi:MAG TPA: hypothetical protein VFE47_28190 [Tepidisphaeraceae bacterium]|jgi:hypothetical protein|nr:hypothetical protein [Tepidisphaeraceae bacterium]
MGTLQDHRIPPDALRASTWVMLAAMVPCLANLFLCTGFLASATWAYEDFGEIMNLSMCAMFPIGFVSAIIGVGAYIRSSRSFGFRLFLAIFVAVILLDCGAFLIIGIKGVGMG